jgi:hypothetical protein
MGRIGQAFFEELAKEKEEGRKLGQKSLRG